MCSFAVKNNVPDLVFAVLVLVLCACAEELLPKFLSVGFPVLFAASHHFAARRPALFTVLFAIAAGAMEDAISSLPAMTSVSSFLLTALFVRWVGFSRVTTALTFACYQVWLSVWQSALGGGVFTRLLVSVPIGLMTALSVEWVLTSLERKAAVNEQG